jgi:hypothetical protein
VAGSEETRLNIVETQISNSVVVKGKAESKVLPKLLLGRKVPSQITLNMVSINSTHNVPSNAELCLKATKRGCS